MIFTCFHLRTSLIGRIGPLSSGHEVLAEAKGCMEPLIPMWFWTGHYSSLNVHHSSLNATGTNLTLASLELAGPKGG